MNTPFRTWGTLLLSCGSAGWLAWGCTQLPAETHPSSLSEARLQRLPRPDTSGYETAAPRDPNGIGKYYLGRQIAHVMGHEGAGWLERNGRSQEEGTDLLLKELQLKPTDVVADIGAGTGFFSFQLARKVPQGRVLADALGRLEAVEHGHVEVHHDQVGALTRRRLDGLLAVDDLDHAVAFSFEEHL